MANLESRISVRDDVLFQDLDGEAVILNLENEYYYGLDEVGTRMWTLLVHHGHVEHAYQILLNEFNVAQDLLLKDLLALVDELASHGLLQVDEI